jgi:Putative amidoligase enzyme
MKVKNLLKLPVKEEREQSTPALCLPKTYVGLEYEWENTSKFPYQTYTHNTTLNAIATAVKSYFAFHVDGSLRENGMEFTFREPYAGTRILAAIDAMDDAARAFSFTASYRTSLHVHLDLSELAYPKDAHRVAALYALVEPLLYKFVGQNRDGCNYCIPWYANPHHYLRYAAVLKPFQKGFTEDRFTNDLGIKLGSELNANKAHHKYSGMNMMSMGQFGTVEFRQAPVNMQKEKILAWINILMRIKKYVMDSQWEPEQLYSQVKIWGPTEFIQRVFLTEANFLLRCTKSVEEDLKRGSLTLFHFISAVKQ